MKLLDLFCGAGGAAMGYHRAGFDEIVGVDIKAQKRYPFVFVQADALAYVAAHGREFDAIHASPPCQRYTRAFRGRDHLRAKHPDLVAAVRAALLDTGRPWIMENVPGSPMRADVILSGAQFDLDVVRVRLFEVSGWPAPFNLARQHSKTVTHGDLASVAGNGTNNAWNLRKSRGMCKWRDLPADLRRRLSERNSVDGWRAAMRIDWMTRDELREAVPPAYTEYLGRELLGYLCKTVEANA